MIRSAIRTEVLRILGDTAQVKFTTAVLNDWIDYANVELMTSLDLDRAVATIALVGSDTFASSEPNYALPTNAMNLRDIYLQDVNNNEQRLRVVDQDDLNGLIGPGWRAQADSNVGLPYLAYQADYNVVGLYPRPNAAANGKTLRFFYDRVPSAFSSDTDTPIYINALHEALVMWTVTRAYDSLGDINRAEYYRKRYDSVMQRFIWKQTKFANDMAGFRWGYQEAYGRY